MTATPPGYESYGADPPEHLLTFGDTTGQQLLLIAPLFEEMNFTRRLVAELGRRLGGRGIGVWIPDLPGTGESERALEEIGWADWTNAVAAAAAHIQRETARTPHIASIRGGALLDHAGEAASRWRFAPASGADLLRQMRRAQSLADKEAGGARTESGIVSLVGYRIAEPLAAALQDAVPAPAVPLRVVPAAAGAVPLWRRAEPAHDPALADQLADDLHAWILTCAG